MQICSSSSVVEWPLDESQVAHRMSHPLAWAVVVLGKLLRLWKMRYRYGTMAVLAPDWAMSAGLADGRPASSLSGHFLEIWPDLLHTWHFLSSIDICGLGQLSLVWPVVLQLAHLLSFGYLGGVANQGPEAPNRRTGAPRCGRPGQLNLPELPRT